MDEKIPAIVLAYSAKEKMTPIAWKITPEKVVIVFEQGPKKSFDPRLETDTKEKPAPKQAPAATKKSKAKPKG